MVDACARDLAPEPAGLLRWHEDYLRDHRLRIAHDLDLIGRSIPKTERILECGSIPLLCTAALVRSGYRVTGCDLAPERYATTIRSAGLNVLRCNVEVEPLPFPDGAFDAVIFNEMFEHLRINPIFTVSELLRVLRPGGVMTLSTPNLKSLGGIRNFLMGDRAYSCAANPYEEYRKLNVLGHMGHVREYTPTEVVEFLEAIGFEVTAVIYRGEYSGIMERALTKLIPRLSPFVSYLARRP